MPTVKAQVRPRADDRASPYPKRSRKCTEDEEGAGGKKVFEESETPVPKPAPICTSVGKGAIMGGEVTPTNGQQPKSRTRARTAATVAPTKSSAHSADHAKTLEKVRQFILNRMSKSKGVTEKIDKQQDAHLVLNFFANVKEKENSNAPTNASSIVGI
jgi:hypothetical protein